MSWLSAALMVMAALGTAYYIVSARALCGVRRHPGSVECDGKMRVSILKPIRGADPRAADNFRTHLAQDYPNYEVLFGALDDDDPGLRAVREVIGDTQDARVHTGAAIDGANSKARILHNLARRALGEIIVITDADVRVGRDFLSRVIAPFDDPKVGVVTCLYRGGDPFTVADRLQALHMSCAFAPGVACANALGGIDFALGAAIAIRRQTLDQIGGFTAIADYLADDFQLGRRAALAGWRVTLSDCVVEVCLGGERLSDVLSRELRWSVTTRVSRPWGHLGLVLTFGFAYAALLAVSMGFSPLGWTIFVAASAIRYAGASAGAKSMGDHASLALLPLRDLLSFAIWVAGYATRTVTWRGRRLRVTKDGRIKPV